MALANTTLGAACAVGDSKVLVAAATGFAIGVKFRIGDEDFKVTKGYVAASLTVPVLRGQDGTVAVAHPSGAQVTVGAGSDWAQEGAAQTIDAYPIAMRARTIREYSASGAIALPTAGSDLLVVLSGVATAMTIVVPTKDLNGSRVTIERSCATGSPLNWNDEGDSSCAPTRFVTVETIDVTSPTAIAVR